MRISETVELCSYNVDEHRMSKRLELREYAIVNCVMFMGSLVGVLS